MSCRKSTDHNPRPTSTWPLLTWDQVPLPVRYCPSLVTTARWACLATNLQTTHPSSTWPLLTWDQVPLPVRYCPSLVTTARWACLATNLQTTHPSIHLTFTHLRSSPSACQILSITCNNCKVSMSCRKSTDHNPRPTSTWPILTWDQYPLPVTYCPSLVTTARWACLAANLQTITPPPPSTWPILTWDQDPLPARYCP